MRCPCGTAAFLIGIVAGPNQGAINSAFRGGDHNHQPLGVCGLREIVGLITAIIGRAAAACSAFTAHIGTMRRQ